MRPLAEQDHFLHLSKDTSPSAAKYEKVPTWDVRGALGTLSPRSQGKGMAITKEPSPKMTGLCSLHSRVGGEEAARPLRPAASICRRPAPTVRNVPQAAAGRQALTTWGKLILEQILSGRQEAECFQLPWSLEHCGKLSFCGKLVRSGP